MKHCLAQRVLARKLNRRLIATLSKHGAGARSPVSFRPVILLASPFDSASATCFFVR